MNVHTFTIPGDPKGWARSRHNGKQHFTPAKQTAYQNTVRWIAKGCGVRVSAGPVCVEITAHFGIPKSATKADRAAMLSGSAYPTKKPDADNIAKAILDALKSIAWADDVQVVSLNVLKLWTDEDPRVEVSLRSYAEEARAAA